MATTRTPGKYRTEAWIVGVHPLPYMDMPLDLMRGGYRDGNVIVRDGEDWTVMSGDEFDRDYEWLRENV